MNLYFQPEYVSKFVCDGSKCDAKCCKQWRIYVDKVTYQKYPQDVRAHMQFDDKHNLYLMELDDKQCCPFLNADKLCRLQLEYSADFLSTTCTTYPRYTRNFKRFFERSLTLSCPVAAELILFNPNPMQFELVELSDEMHSLGGKIEMAHVSCSEKLAPRMLETQIAMISILQERTLTIDQRLVVLGFFLDKLDEITTGGVNEFALIKLIDAYESKQFLAEQVPLMLQTVHFNPRRFIGLMLKLFNTLYGGTNEPFVIKVADALQIVPDKNNRVAISAIVANYQRLAYKRNAFLATHSTFLENYLVNELFMHCYPWRYDKNVAANYGLFITTYKIFELILFAATLEGLDSKDDLIEIVSWFTRKINHIKQLHDIIVKQLKSDSFGLMETFLDTKRAVL